jgi:hypothetical protein
MDEYQIGASDHPKIDQPVAILPRAGLKRDRWNAAFLFRSEVFTRG